MSDQSDPPYPLAAPQGEGAPLASADSARARDERECVEQREFGRRMARSRASRLMRLSLRGMFFLMFGAAIVMLIAGILTGGVGGENGYSIPLTLVGIILWGAYVVHRDRRARRTVASLADALRGTWSVDRPEEAFEWLDRHWRSLLPNDMLISLQTFDHRWIVRATWQGYPVLVFWIRINESDIDINKTIVFVSRRDGSAGFESERPAVEEEHFALARFPAGVRGECTMAGLEALQWHRIRRVLDRSVAMIEGDRNA